MKSPFLKIALLLCLAAAASVGHAAPAGTRNPNWATPVDLPPVENFYEVEPGLYRSAQPNRASMLVLEKFGIRSVISMRAFNSDDKEAEGTSLVLYRVPIHTWDIEEDEIVAVLRLIKTVERPVLVHCQHGADRTGLMIALVRILDQGWTREEALDELQNGDYGYHSIWGNIPEYIKKFDIEALKDKVGREYYPSTPPQAQ